MQIQHNGKLRASSTVKRTERVTKLLARTAVCAVLALVFAILAPGVASAQTLSATPSQGPPGTSVTVSGSGLPSATNIDVDWDDETPALANATTDASGSFTVNVVVPGNASLGVHHFRVRRPLTSGALASVPFPVTNPTDGSLPDLTPTAITVNGAAYTGAQLPLGTVIHFDSGVTNQGGTGTGVFNVRWLVDGQDVNAYGSHEGVPAHATVINGNSYFDWMPTPGNHKITFTVDSDNFIGESKESNNATSITVNVRKSHLDLVPSSAPFGATQCSDVLFLSASGSGESHRIGKEMDIVRSAVNQALPQSVTLRQVYVDYTAAKVKPSILVPGKTRDDFFYSMSEGDQKMGEALMASFRTCGGKEKWIIAGYSQGAYAANSSARGWGVATASPLSAVILLADPLRVPDQVGTALGTALPGTGVWNTLQFPEVGPLPSTLSGAVTDICNYGDLVCDTSHVSLGSPASVAFGILVHTSYETVSVNLLQSAGRGAAALALQTTGG